MEVSRRERPMETTTSIKMPGTPKPWMNRVMTTMLRTPGLRRLLGRTFAIITVTGATTGRRYDTPVQALRDRGRFVVLSQRHRIWWRNLRTRPEVELVVQGRTLTGRAVIADGEEAREVIARCLAQNPRIAKFYDIAIADDGTADPAGVAALAAAAVAIVIDV
jgi:deazaflavin-dependent oxidoreductase (nitroreductase family)